MKNFNKAASDAITVTSASGVDPRKAQMGSKLGTVSRMRKELKGDKEKARQRKKKDMGMKAQSKAGRAPKMPETAQKGTKLCGGGKTSRKCGGGKMKSGGIMYQTGGTVAKDPTFSPEQKMGMMQMGANLAGQVGTAVLDNRKSKAEEKELAKKNHEDKLKAYQQGSVQSAKSAIQQNKATTTLPPQTAPINNMSANGQAPQQPMPQAPAPRMAAPTAGQMMPGQAAGAVVGGAQNMVNKFQTPANTRPRNLPASMQQPTMQQPQAQMYKLGGVVIKLKK